MGERVVASAMSIQWEPNAPDAVMVSQESGETRLAVRAHPDDSDQRTVVLVWNEVEFASFSAPNDEAITGHPLWRAGLSDVTWIGIVQDSELIAQLEAQDSEHPRSDSGRYDSLRHYVVPLKERLVQVVSGELHVERIEGNTLQSATGLQPPPA